MAMKRPLCVLKFFESIYRRDSRHGIMVLSLAAQKRGGL